VPTAANHLATPHPFLLKPNHGTKACPLNEQGKSLGLNVCRLMKTRSKTFPYNHLGL
jgi:hypothetical protein